MKNLKSSVDKTFAILEHFTVEKNEWGVTELAHAIGSNKSTIYRFLSDLQRLGILSKNPHSEKYSLGIKLFELGSRVNLRRAFVDKSHPELQKVALSITETVHIGIFKNNQVFYVDKVESPQGLRISSRIGSYSPGYATALGKVLLAHLPTDKQDETIDAIFSKDIVEFTENTVKSKDQLKAILKSVYKNGYAIDHQEYEIGLICVAIPIFNTNNEVVASLSASGPANRFQEDEVKNYVATLQKGADAIQQKIGLFKP